MRPRKQFEDEDIRTVLVTGSTRGIGRAIALMLAQSGYNVVINARKPSLEAEVLLETLRSMKTEPRALYFDVTDREAARTTLMADVEAHGAYWGVVLNAGINRDGPLVGMCESDWDDVIDVSLGGFYNVLKPVLLPMARLRRGRIVVMSSVSGIYGTRGQTNYSAAKAGLIGAAKALAAELASRCLTVNVVAPGLINTGMVSQEDRRRITPLIPMGRVGDPEEVAAVVRFLLSREASYVTSAVIPVSGGL